MIQQVVHAAHDQVDAGGFERFEESRGQSQRDAVAIPEQLAPAGDKAQEARVGQRLLAHRAHQVVERLGVAQVGAAVDVAVADAMLQRDAPLPAGGPRRGQRVGRARAGELRRHRYRPVARQHVAPVQIAGLQGLLDQQPAKAAAIDIQIGLQPRAVGEHQLIEKSVGALGRGRDGTFQSRHAALLGITAQILGDQRGVELQRIAQAGGRPLGLGVRKPELAGIAQRRAQAVVVKARRQAVGLGPMPVVVERPAVDRWCRRYRTDASSSGRCAASP